MDKSGSKKICIPMKTQEYYYFEKSSRNNVLEEKTLHTPTQGMNLCSDIQIQHNTATYMYTNVCTYLGICNILY